MAGTTDPDTTRFDGLFDDRVHGALPIAGPLAGAHTLAVDDVLDLPVVEVGPAPYHRTAPFLLSDHRNGEPPRTIRASAPAMRADVMLQVAHRGAFVAVPATATLRAVPGVTFAPIVDVPRLASGLAVARAAAEPTLVDAFRDVARVMTGGLLPLLPDARLLPCG